MLRLIPVIVILPIIIIDFPTRHFHWFNIIQCIDCDRIPFPTNLLAIESMEGMHTAMFAEQLVMPIGLVNVIGQVVFAADETEIGRPGSKEPQTQFDTSGTIAFAGAVGEVEVRFVFDLAAYAAAMILLGRHCV